MDEVTQQNAALVEQAAAAAGSLHDQAQRLVDTVQVFQLSSAIHKPAPRIRKQDSALPENYSIRKAPQPPAAPKLVAGGGSASDWESF